MSNTLYFVRDKQTEAAATKIVDLFCLEMTFDDGKEKIYKGNDMLISFAKRYLFVYLYRECDQNLISNVRQILQG